MSAADTGSPRGLLAKASPLLKIAFGAGVFAWMASSGKLNFHELGRSFSHWPLMLAILALGYCQVAIISWRWRMLLAAQQIPLAYGRTWGLSMIGMLFNAAIPGSVGGDLIKGYYIARAAGGRGTHAATSILMDRVTGLIGLFFLGAAGALFNLDETLRNSATRVMGALVVAGFAASLAGLYAAIFAGDRLSRWMFLPRVLRTIFAALHEYRVKPGVAPAALALSVVNQAISCLALYLALLSTGASLPAGQFLLSAPLGVAATAVPIAPAGIGVGQAAFFALFRIVAPAYASAGTAAFTAFQAVVLLLCLSGLIWYIPYRQESGGLAAREPED
jgi:glycosyltransferase 2 family protein